MKSDFFFLIIFNIYELPNNNILILSQSCQEYATKCVCGSCYKYKNKEFVFNIDGNKIIKSLENIKEDDSHSFKKDKCNSKIIIMSKYICLYKKKAIYFYNISDFILLKGFSIYKFRFCHFYDNKIFVISYWDKGRFYLYDFDDINNIRFQEFYFCKILMPVNENNIPGRIIKKTKIKEMKGRKIMLIYNENIYIIKFTKQFEFSPYNEYAMPIIFSRNRNNRKQISNCSNY